MLNKLKAHASQYVQFSEIEWESFCNCLNLLKVKKNEYFLRQGIVCKKMGFIVQGFARLYYQLGEEEFTKDFSLENSFCGSYASFITGHPSNFNVKAMENLVLYTIDRKSLTDLTEQFPCWQKFKLISVENLFMRKENREASFLLDSPERRYEKLVKDNKEMLQRIPLKYLASYLGVTAETLSRIRAKQK